MRQKQLNGRQAKRNCSIIRGLSMIGWLVATSIKLAGVTRTNHCSGNVVYHLYNENEAVVSGLFLPLATLFFAYFRHRLTTITLTSHRIRSLLSNNIASITAVLVFVITLSGTFLIFHNFALCTRRCSEGAWLDRTDWQEEGAKSTDHAALERSFGSTVDAVAFPCQCVDITKYNPSS